MSWLQVYEIAVPHYEIRNGKHVFALQLQRYRANNNTSTSNSSDSADGDDWNAQRDPSATTRATTSYVTALQSYSQFRTLWKELLRATKSTITTSSPLTHDSRATFARRNHQTRQRLWSSQTQSTTQSLSSSLSSRSSSAAVAPATAAAMASPLGSGACQCSNACCPFTRLHWVLKSYPFPARLVLTRTSPAVLEARRVALEQFVVTLREFFIGFPRSFLHAVDATERCRVLDAFSTFLGFSNELRAMAVSRSPLLVAAWKADLLLHREQSHTSIGAAGGARSDAVAFYCSDDHTDVHASFPVVPIDNHNDEADDENDCKRPVVYVPSLQTSYNADGDDETTAVAAAPDDEEEGDEDESDDDGNSDSMSSDNDNDLDNTAARATATTTRTTSTRTTSIAAARKYERGSSVYILGRDASTSTRTARKTHATLPTLRIQNAQIKPIRAFVVDFRNHLLAQFADVLDATNNCCSGASTRAVAALSDARQWELGLYLASHIGQLYAVESMIARGTNVNMRAGDDTTPLHVACRAGHSDVVDCLVAHGADVNALDQLGMTPLLLAITHSDVDLVRLLLDRGADVNVHNAKRVSAAHVAVASQSLVVLSLLLEYDAFVNVQNMINGKTPLHLAAESGQYAMCELLLNHGANVHQRTTSGCDAYGLAVAHGHVHVAELCRAFQRHSLRVTTSRELFVKEEDDDDESRRQVSPLSPSPRTIPATLAITPLRQSILRTTMAMAAHATNGGCSGAHDAVKIVAQDGHSYAVL